MALFWLRSYIFLHKPALGLHELWRGFTASAICLAFVKENHYLAVTEDFRTANPYTFTIQSTASLTFTPCRFCLLFISFWKFVHPERWKSLWSVDLIKSLSLHVSANPNTHLGFGCLLKLWCVVISARFVCTSIGALVAVRANFQLSLRLTAT